MCRSPPPPPPPPPATSALLNSLVQFFWTSQQHEQQIFSPADPQQSSQSKRMFCVMVTKKECSREITLWTSAIDVYKCRKTVSVYCIKTNESEKGREREKGVDLMEKTFQSAELLVGLNLNRFLTQLQSNRPPCLHDKSPICKWCKEQVCCLSLKEPNMDKLRGKLGETSGMELSSF